MSELQGYSLDDVYAATPNVRSSTLGYTTNNRYENFPPIMNDGRSITASYQPEAVINNELLVNTGIKTNFEYRKYLTRNSQDIMKYNFGEACNDAGYYKRFANPVGNNNLSSSPYLYKSIFDKHNAAGVDNSDLKQLYLSREQLDARKVSPIITQDELLRNL